MKLSLFILSFLVTACAQTPTVDTSKSTKVEQNVTIGNNLNSNRFADIYFSAQPTASDIAKLKTQGFKHIINLRQTTEYNEAAEKKNVTNLGLNYTNIPFGGKEALTDKFISSVTKAVMTHRKQGKTLVHCGSGNRVGAWVGGHFRKDHKYSKEDSINMAKKMGLTNQGQLNKLQSYLQTK